MTEQPPLTPEDVPIWTDGWSAGYAAGMGRALALAEQWDEMARDHDEQGATVTAMVYRSHARLIRNALADAR